MVNIAPARALPTSRPLAAIACEALWFSTVRVPAPAGRACKMVEGTVNWPALAGTAHMKLAPGVGDPAAANGLPRIATTPSESPPVQVRWTPCERLIPPMEVWLVQSRGAGNLKAAVEA